MEAAGAGSLPSDLAAVGAVDDALIDHDAIDHDAAFWEGDDFDSDTLLEEESGPSIDTGNVEWCASCLCPISCIIRVQVEDQDIAW